jgi:hypothetical protein
MTYLQGSARAIAPFSTGKIKPNADRPYRAFGLPVVSRLHLRGNSFCSLVCITVPAATIQLGKIFVLTT